MVILSPSDLCRSAASASTATKRGKKIGCLLAKAGASGRDSTVARPPPGGSPLTPPLGFVGLALLQNIFEEREACRAVHDVRAMSGRTRPRIAERETDITELLQQQSKARCVVLTKHVRPLRRVERRRHREVSRRECRRIRQIPEPVACLGSAEVVALALDY